MSHQVRVIYGTAIAVLVLVSYILGAFKLLPGDSAEASAGEHAGGAAWGVFDFERPSSGCRFAPRCPVHAARGKPPICTDPMRDPTLRPVRDGHLVACHFPL